MYTVAGILIAGRSSRMGRPKPLIEIDGRTILERTVAVAREVCDAVVLLGSPPFVLPPTVAILRLVKDAPPDVGPIGGLAALLATAAPNPAVLLACDLPRLDSALLHMLLDAIDCTIDAVTFKTSPDAPHLESTCAAYMPSAATQVEKQITNREYSLQSLFAALRVKTITLQSADAAMLANMNTPADVPAAKPE